MNDLDCIESHGYESTTPSEERSYPAHLLLSRRHFRDGEDDFGAGGLTPPERCRAVDAD